MACQRESEQSVCRNPIRDRIRNRDARPEIRYVRFAGHLRKRRIMQSRGRVIRLTGICLAFASLIGCGGGGGGSGSPPGNGGGTPPPAVTPAPSALTYAGPLTLVVGTAITPLNPSVTGTVASYSISPELPAGLTLNPLTGVLSGTPSAPAAQGDYTITARNAGGETTYVLELAVALPDRVLGDVWVFALRESRRAARLLDLGLLRIEPPSFTPVYAGRGNRCQS